MNLATTFTFESGQHFGEGTSQTGYWKSTNTRYKLRNSFLTLLIGQILKHLPRNQNSNPLFIFIKKIGFRLLPNAEQLELNAFTVEKHHFRDSQPVKHLPFQRKMIFSEVSKPCEVQSPWQKANNRNLTICTCGETFLGWTHAALGLSTWKDRLNQWPYHGHRHPSWRLPGKREYMHI